ncbi:hypothetical protein B0H13DRAFT_2332953 [Mycena leptocephala]|nr:hypothetical protein B0H13DRAFT_2332953 [Mycena leptocephala]
MTRHSSARGNPRRTVLRRIGALGQLRPICPLPSLLSTTIRALLAKYSLHLLPSTSRLLSIPLSKLIYPFPSTERAGRVRYCHYLFYAGSDRADVDAGDMLRNKDYVPFFVFSFFHHFTIPLAAVWFVVPYSLIPFPVAPWPSLSWSPLLPLSLIRYQYQRACSSLSTSPNVNIITISGYSDSGALPFQPPLFPSFHLVSSHSKHAHDSTPFFHPSHAAHKSAASSTILMCSSRLYTMFSLRSTPVFRVPAPTIIFFFLRDGNIPYLACQDTPPHIWIWTSTSLSQPGHDTLPCILYRASPVFLP